MKITGSSSGPGYKASSDLSGDYAFQGLSLPRALAVSAGLLALTYFLFQRKLLPLPVSKFVSKMFFHPTFPLTALMRIGNYWTKVDETLYVGCAPFGWCKHPELLNKMGIKGVVNMCYEFDGPKNSYARLGIKQLHLPTIDHTDPTLDSIKEAVAFIKQCQLQGEKVLTHCKAGHGRGACIALCWMMHENRDMSPKVTKSIYP
jgi:atypical dual specificity phosphatase